MKELMIKLIDGMQIKDVPRVHRELIDELINFKILSYKKSKIKLSREYRVGELDINRAGVGYLTPLLSRGKDILIEPYDLANATKNDLVIAKTFRKKGRVKAKVIYILDKKFSHSVVTLKQIGSKIFGVNIKSDAIIELKASIKSLKVLPKDAILKVDNRDNSITEVLGVLSDSRVDEKIALGLYNKKEEFSKLSELEAKSYGEYVDKDMYPERVDLSHLNFCTIDPDSAKDFDDAIYYDSKNRELYIAIADVSEYVTESSSIDKEAIERGFSIYLPHKSIPMLPRALSENLCSLKPDEYRLAFTFKITFDENFNIVNEELFDAIIKSKRRFTYGEIDQYLEQNLPPKSELDEKILIELQELNKLAKILRERRFKKGYDFNLDDVRVNIDSKFNITSVEIESETTSHSLIEECMLLANSASAKMFEFGIFRTHEEPDYKSIQDLIQDLSTIGIFAKEDSTDLHKMIISIQREAKRKNLSQFVDKLIVKSQKQASYTSENIGHFGLGFKHYSHFTSPIRRYSDLILHRLLKSITRDDSRSKKYILRNIQAIATKVSELEREASRVEWDFLDRVFARYAKSKEALEVSATVVDIERAPYIAKVDSGVINGARVFIRDRERLNLFDRVIAKVVDVDLLKAKIYVDIIESAKLEIE